LLQDSKINGAEFTAFVLAFALLGVALGFAPEVQELSIAGSVLKLREVKEEALQAIESLNKSRVEIFRMLIAVSLIHTGHFANTRPSDPRIAGFKKMVKLASDSDCAEELRAELISATETLLRAQFDLIKWRNKSPKLMAIGPYPHPLDLAAVAFDPEGVAEALQRVSPAPNNYSDEIRESLLGYGDLYNLRDGFLSSR